jgi:hypothetical protein
MAQLERLYTGLASDQNDGSQGSRNFEAGSDGSGGERHGNVKKIRQKECNLGCMEETSKLAWLARLVEPRKYIGGRHAYTACIHGIHDHSCFRPFDVTYGLECVDSLLRRTAAPAIGTAYKLCSVPCLQERR